MRRLALLLFCLLALSELCACGSIYDDLVYPEKVHEPGTQ